MTEYYARQETGKDYKYMLLGSDDDTQHSELVSFGLPVFQKLEKHNVPDTGSLSVLRWGGGVK
jgi:hypothetical protein